jgi:hypothetical protein
MVHTAEPRRMGGLRENLTGNYGFTTIHQQNMDDVPVNFPLN